MFKTVSMNQELTYCANEVREHDPDRFLLSMLMPADRREALFALFAFNYEIAKTREVVSETQLGLIRLQWWREAIVEIYQSGVALEHEVLQSLARVIDVYDIPQVLFEDLIYAREFDLEDVLPGDLEGMLKYVDYTSTPLMKMVMHVLDAGEEEEIVRGVAMNYALVGILRSVPFLAQERRCYLPQDLLNTHEQRMDHLYEGKAAIGLKQVVREVAVRFDWNLKPRNKFLRSSLKLSKLYVKQIQACDYDVYNPKMALEPLFKALRIL